jgi:large subunit ribosomal protein L13e
MGFRHNNQLPNAHFHKHWQRRVKTWFDQPGKKRSRRVARAEKASRIAPRPVDGLLRPAVRCPTFKYNIKLRSGRGFTLEELKAAGIAKKVARTIGIAVDFRRKNRSEESLNMNVERLKEYKNRLVLFPKKSKDRKSAPQDVKQLTGSLMPVKNIRVVEAPRRITDAEKKFNAYATLRKAQSDARLVGVREKRRKEKEQEEEVKAKK